MMPNTLSPNPIENRFLSLVGVAAFCYAVLWMSPMSVIAEALSYDHSVHFLNFERHFWQYAAAFTAMVLLSRGHLWSYGINSQHLKISMKWLAWLYGVVIAATAFLFIAGYSLLPVSAADIPVTTSGTMLMMLVFWMSSPVANQILFFGFGQTILMKHWGLSMNIAGIPLGVIFSALLFTAGATTSWFYPFEISYAATFGLGLFCGIVYWKTHSLITPMLAHAFFFGFPLFVHLLFAGMNQ